MGYSALRITFFVAALMALSALSIAHLQSTHILVACGAVGLFFALCLRHAIMQFRRDNIQPIEEIPPGLPLDKQIITQNFLKLEAQLEHAPVALFLMATDGASPAALNNFARRMLAPGRASNVTEFNAKLIEADNGRRNVITFDTEQGQERALVAVSHVHIYGSEQRLFAVLPIENELEEVALKSWQQLVHVLTHEIMNSLTPVASLSHTACDLLTELTGKLNAENHAAPEITGDLSIALDAIARRAESLMGFVTSFRSLTNIPAPHPERIRLDQLFARLTALLNTNWEARNGSASFVVEPGTLELVVDAGQLEQAIINLIKNAEEATANTDKPTVSVQARLTRGNRLRIEINDNGPGVPVDLIPHIFTPFFTTKAKGSGIGLAMVKQLVHNNGGTVRYVKPANSGARFILTF